MQNCGIDLCCDYNNRGISAFTLCLFQGDGDDVAGAASKVPIVPIMIIEVKREISADIGQIADKSICQLMLEAHYAMVKNHTKSLVAVVTDLASWHVLKVGVGEPPSLLDVTHSTSLSTPGDLEETVHCLSSIVIEEISQHI